MQLKLGSCKNSSESGEIYVFYKRGKGGKNSRNSRRMGNRIHFAINEIISLSSSVNNCAVEQKEKTHARDGIKDQQPVSRVKFAGGLLGTLT